MAENSNPYRPPTTERPTARATQKPRAPLLRLLFGGIGFIASCVFVITIMITVVPEKRWIANLASTASGLVVTAYILTGIYRAANARR